MFVAIEGMDGVGKTTIAKKIAELFKMEYIEKPMQKFLNMSDKDYDDLCVKIWTSTNPNTSAWFFNLGNMITIDLAKDVIVDRHILSTYYWDSSKTNEKIFELMINDEIIPDITFILYSSTATRIERIKARNQNDEDLKMDKTLDFGYDKLVGFAQRINIPYIIINTENKNIEQVLYEVENTLRLVLDKTPEEVHRICDIYNTEFEKNNIEKDNDIKKLVRRKK